MTSVTSWADQPCYTIINAPAEHETPTDMALKQVFSKGTIPEKTQALKKLIISLSNGEKISPSMLMTVIQYVMPTQDHHIKKLLFIFWEVVPKYGPDGKLLHEFILVCDAYRKDLQHPNEFVRGCTLRFLCKLREPELLEPLMPAIRECLNHRHSYVRRNAVLAIFTIYKNYDHLIPDGPELVAKYLEGEKDPSCRRNAFMMLIHADQDKALSYLISVIDQVPNFGDILQLVIVELIYKVCHSNPAERPRFIRCVYNLLAQAASNSVKYEAASTLITLSSAPSAVKAVSQCYIDLILKEADNNVKLIVLGKLIDMKEDSAKEKVMQDLVMDVMRILSSSDIDVRKKTLDLCLDLVTNRTVQEMVLVLKKEVVKCQSTSVEQEGSEKYRQLLVRTLHRLAIKFPDTATVIIPTLIEFLSDKSDLAAGDVLVFLREAMQKYPNLRALIIAKLLEALPSTQSVKVYRAALWILGEFCHSPEDIQATMTLIRQGLGELPIVDDELRKAAGTDNADEEKTASQASAMPQKLVTDIGTYATQSAFSMGTSGGKSSAASSIDRPVLRRFLMSGEFFVGSAVASTLCKLALRFVGLTDNKKRQNAFVAEAIFVVASIMRLGKSGLPTSPVSADEYNHMQMCLRVLADRLTLMQDIVTQQCRSTLTQMLALCAVDSEDDKTAAAQKRFKVKAQVDDPIAFVQLLGDADMAASGDMNLFDLTLSQALTGGKKDPHDAVSVSKLSKVTQLTGFSDPVYAEAYVNVNQYDIVLDVFLVNQTSDTLQSLILELATLGDLKLVEKPVPITLGPHDFTNIKASIKVASTENGVIFGNIVYDIHGATADRSCVVLNDIHIDIMDYIVPASCTDVEFRTMWASFEWENKVPLINCNLTSLRDYIDHLVVSTNMKCLTPEAALAGECGFLTANLFARSVFGEDALVNVSIEKNPANPDDHVTGHIRIRAKSQGMALSLGEKITNCQKKAKPTSAGAKKEQEAVQNDD